MRLIDADALLRDIEVYHLSDGKFQHWVEVQPTIDPQRKGHWIKEMNVIENNGDTIIRPEWYCSQCRSKYDPNMARRINFCCVCGADMRGDEDAAD